jgi:hypothetical protein
MLHACNAVDGTAKKVFGNTLGGKQRFVRLLRENYYVLGPMGLPGINIYETRFPIIVQKPTASDGKPDLADLIYGIHRCCHDHGDELPDGFELLANASGPHGYTKMQFSRGKAQLSDRIIFGLLAVAVFCPVNVGQRVPDGYFLLYATSTDTASMIINEWWGRAADFPSLLAKFPPMPNITIDFSTWMPMARE